jgi:hypothetical protein
MRYENCEIVVLEWIGEFKKILIGCDCLRRMSDGWLHKWGEVNAKSWGLMAEIWMVESKGWKLGIEGMSRW